MRLASASSQRAAFVSTGAPRCAGSCAFGCAAGAAGVAPGPCGAGGVGAAVDRRSRSARPPSAAETPRVARFQEVRRRRGGDGAWPSTCARQRSVGARLRLCGARKVAQQGTARARPVSRSPHARGFRSRRADANRTVPAAPARAHAPRDRAWTARQGPESAPCARRMGRPAVARRFAPRTTASVAAAEPVATASVSASAGRDTGIAGDGRDPNANASRNASRELRGRRIGRLYAARGRGQRRRRQRDQRHTRRGKSAERGARSGLRGELFGGRSVGVRRQGFAARQLTRQRIAEQLQQQIEGRERGVRAGVAPRRPHDVRRAAA